MHKLQTLIDSVHYLQKNRRFYNGVIIILIISGGHALMLVTFSYLLNNTSNWRPQMFFFRKTSYPSQLNQEQLKSSVNKRTKGTIAWKNLNEWVNRIKSVKIHLIVNPNKIDIQMKAFKFAHLCTCGRAIAWNGARRWSGLLSGICPDTVYFCSSPTIATK